MQNPCKVSVRKYLIVSYHPCSLRSPKQVICPSLPKLPQTPPPTPWLGKFIVFRFKYIVFKLLEMHLWVKNLILDIFTHAKTKLSSRFLSSTHRQWEINYSLEQDFSKICSSPSKEGWVGWRSGEEERVTMHYLQVFGGIFERFW